MDEEQISRLAKRLDRERRARLEAEQIAERSTRNLYESQLEISLLQRISVAANEASTLDDALQAALDDVCSYTRWPVGHAYLASAAEPDMLVPSSLWHLEDPSGFAAFRQVTERSLLQRGAGLPGRVLETGDPAWIIDVNDDPNFPRARQAQSIGVKAGFAFPIRAGQEIVGVLEFFARDAIEPNERLLAIMAHVGTQLGRVIERSRAEGKIRHMAYHDALTGLPNRWLLEDRFEVAIAQARRNGGGLTVASLDLDRFKLVNDSFGHLVGDRLLVQTSRRLASLIRDDSSLARFGGDEFMLLLPGVGSAEDAARIADRIVAAFRKPFGIEELELHATISVGIGLYPEDGEDAETLMRNSDTALYRAKELGRNGYQLYRPAMTARATERMRLEEDLRRAVAAQEFFIEYQPVVDARRGEIVGAEALIRWNHPSRGVLSPTEFIAVAEETGLIIELGEWVLSQSCLQMHRWEAAGLGPLRIAVNVSLAQFNRPDFVGTVRRILRETAFDPRRLDLEITESIAMTDPNAAIAILQELGSMGIRISIDDFGTGFSSLAYLKDLPVHNLKIDRSFVTELTEGSGDATIAQSIISLAHNLNLKVIAEGVETPEQASFLQARQCDEFQGFLWSKALPAEDFEKLVRGGVAAGQVDARLPGHGFEWTNRLRRADAHLHATPTTGRV